MDDSGTSCDEIINADAKTKQNDEEKKKFRRNFNEKKFNE